jgi:glutaredoxin/predicted outer membrane lipoprotein
MKQKGWLFAVLLATVFGALNAAQLYQWKDEQGRVVYSDQPPPPSVKNAQQRKFQGSFIEVGESYALRIAREKFPVTLYATACGPACDQARQLLNARGIPFTDVNPESNPEAQADLQKLTGRLHVPVLMVGKDKVDGFETGQWQAALDRAGYPKEPAPGYKPEAAAPAPSR